MNLPMVTVTARLKDQQGNPLAGAIIRFKLSCVEKYQGLIVPRESVWTADENGVASMQIFPNELGSERSEYHVHITAASDKPCSCSCSGGKSTAYFSPLRFSVCIPNTDCNLFDCVNLPPYQRRGCGEVLPSEVLNYASQAGQYADEAESHADRASAIQSEVAGQVDLAVAAKEAALAAQRGAEAARDSFRDAKVDAENAIRTFESTVVDQTEATAQRIQNEAISCIEAEKETAIAAVRENTQNELNSSVQTITEARTEAVNAVNNRREVSLSDIDSARLNAKEELAEIAAQYDEDFNQIVQRAETNARKSACSAASSAQSATRACKCADEADNTLKNIKRELRRVAVEEIMPGVIDDATAIALEASANAKDSETKAKASEDSARESAQIATTKASEAARSALKAEDLAIGVISPDVIARAAELCHDQVIEIVSEVPEQMQNLIVSMNYRTANFSNILLLHGKEIDDLRVEAEEAKEDFQNQIEADFQAISDSVDGKVQSAKDELNTIIDSTANNLNDKIDTVENELSEKADDIEQRLTYKADKIEKQLTERTDEIADQLGQAIVDSAYQDSMHTLANAKLRQHVDDLNDTLSNRLDSESTRIENKIDREAARIEEKFDSESARLESKFDAETSRIESKADEHFQNIEVDIAHNKAAQNTINIKQTVAIDSLKEESKRIEEKIDAGIENLKSNTDEHFQNIEIDIAHNKAAQDNINIKQSVALGEIQSRFDEKQINDVERFSNLSYASVVHTRKILELTEQESKSVLNFVVSGFRLSLMQIKNAYRDFMHYLDMQQREFDISGVRMSDGTFLDNTSISFVSADGETVLPLTSVILYRK